MRPQICKGLIFLSLKSPLPHLHKTSTSLFFYSTSKHKKSESTIAVLDYLINEHHFSPEAAVRASSSVSTYLKKPENADSILSFLKESGFSQTHIELVVKRRPGVLSAQLDVSIKPKIKVFQDLGFTGTDIAEIVSADPWILTRRADCLGHSILVLKSILVSNADVCRVLKFGWFLNNDLEKTLMPNIEFMKHCGISSLQVVKYMFLYPRFLLHKPESIRDFVKTVDEMGFDRKSKMFLSAIRTVSSMKAENWKLKLQLFRSLGFSENDILSMFRRVPQAFAVSERKIKEVTELLVGAGNVDISFIVDHPEILVCSIEHRLKPRLQIVDTLEKKNMLKKKPALSTICKMTDKNFLDKYVLPYSNELRELNAANGGFIDNLIHTKCTTIRKS